MALNKTEILGNDRYFKYRYANATPVNIMTIKLRWLDETDTNWYTFMAEYFQRFFNMKVNFREHRVRYRDFEKPFYSNKPSHFFHKAHVIMFEMSGSFFEGRLDHFTPSPPCGIIKSIILSQPQVTVTSTSWSFLNMDTDVEILTVSTLVLLSLLLVVHSIVTNKYKLLPARKAVKKMARETLEYVWENASLLCAEAIPSVLPHITCRLLAASWMICATFILFFLGCFMRTEFTTESYNRIDSLSDLIKSGIPPEMMYGSADVAYLEHLSKLDPVVKQWFDALDREKMYFGPESDLNSINFYTPVISGKKAIIVQDSLLSSMMLFPESTKFLLDKGGLHFSRDSVTQEYQHFVFNTSWMRKSPQIEKNVQLSVAPFFEMQVFKYHGFEFKYKMERLTWKKPLKSEVALDLSSVSVPFYFLLTLLSATVAVVTTEIIFNQFA